MAGTEENIQEQGIPTITLTVEASESVSPPVDKTLSIPDMPAEAKATGDAIANLQSAISDNAQDIQALQEETAADIPMSEAEEAPTIAATIQSMQNAISRAELPVGTIIMTTSGTAPGFVGTWEEVLMPMTWGDLKNGTRGYRTPAEGEDTGPIHFWMRTA